ncbi:MAG: universal stress protein [Syntrophobacteraceae bacterium]
MNDQPCPKKGLNTLLLATDGADLGKSSLQEALNLAKLCSSKLITVAVVGTDRHYEDVLAWQREMERLEEEMRDRLESFRHQASKEGVDIEILIRWGEEPYLEIVEEATKNRAGMVIMGTHGRTGLKRLLKGSVTANVIGYAPCNVLVVPSDVKLKYRNILVSTDGSIHSTAATSEAIAIAKRCAATLVVLSVAPSDAEVSAANDNVTQVVATAQRENVSTEGVVARGNPPEVIVEVSKQKNADLIVVGSHGRTGLMHLLMGSVTEQVICHAEAAVLVVKAR